MLIFVAVLVKISLIFRFLPLGDLILPRARVGRLTVPTLVAKAIMVVTALVGGVGGVSGTPPLTS